MDPVIAPQEAPHPIRTALARTAKVAGVAALSASLVGPEVAPQPVAIDLAPAIAEAPETIDTQPTITEGTMIPVIVKPPVETPRPVHDRDTVLPTTIVESLPVVDTTTTTTPSVDVTTSTAPANETTTTSPETTQDTQIPEDTQPAETTSTELPPEIPIITPETTVPADETQDTVDTTPETTTPLRTLPEAAPITPEIEKMLKENTVYLEFAGCSGYLIRNTDGEPIGAVTAEHCSLRDINRQREHDAEGNGYIQVDAPLRVTQGETMSQMKEIATVGSIIVPKTGDLSQDFAVLVFEGQNPTDVYAAVNETPQLAVGDTAYLSGWPVDQDNNTTGEMRRQQWPMTYIGSMDAAVTSGEYLADVKIFALKSNADGAECSFGDSGGEAVTADGEGIGALAIFNEFVPDTWQTSVEGAEMARKDYERIFGVDLSGYTNICGFSSKQPIENMEQYSIRTPEVDHSNDHQYEMLNRAVMEFADSAIQKSFLDGSIVINKGGPGSLPYIENPFLLTDETGDMMLYWRDDMNKSGFSYMYIKNSPGVFLPVYRDASATAENGIELTSGVMSPVDFNGIPAYQDENGSIAGHPSNELPADATNWYLSVVDGKFTVTQASQK